MNTADLAANRFTQFKVLAIFSNRAADRRCSGPGSASGSSRARCFEARFVAVETCQEESLFESRDRDGTRGSAGGYEGDLRSIQTREQITLRLTIAMTLGAYQQSLRANVSPRTEIMPWGTHASRCFRQKSGTTLGVIPSPRSALLPYVTSLPYFMFVTSVLGPKIVTPTATKMGITGTISKRIQVV